ncbi:hypothetical protein ACFSX9_10685 [Flavobacterium ardleyense]|uniref:Uncharacterized protein n=1 Tax=Flavobacterium ardleyense TaxID=2038737 RepID=A0ABW5ZA39_9FLAO
MDVNIDKIISGKFKKVVAEIEVKSFKNDGIEYNALIIKNNFPIKLLMLIKKFHEEVDNFAFSIVDEVEREIQLYDLYIESNNSKIFHLKMIE